MECTARGSNVGLVQVLNEVVSVFLFHVQVECVHGQCSSGNTSVEVLIAVSGIPIAGETQNTNYSVSQSHQIHV